MATETTKRRLYRGKWGGLSAVTLATFFGCSSSHVKRMLTKKKEELGRNPTLEEISDMAFAFRKSVEERKLVYIEAGWRVLDGKPQV
jgi:AraC-like DNA-binding protein